jgi:integral membrane sensor domain MASE1
VALSYYIVFRAGLLFTFQNTPVTPVWPLTGIVFAIILIVGLKAIPGIVIGSVITQAIVFTEFGLCNAPTAAWVSVLTSIGYTLELLIGCALLKRIPERVIGFERVKPVFEFTLAVLFMCLAGATSGSVALCLSGISNWNSFPGLWITWWLGDIAGIFLLTPLIVTAYKFLRGKWRPRKKIEMGIVFVLIFIIGGFIFGDWITENPSYLKPYLMLPPLLWAAFRFGQLETLIAITTSLFIAIWETIHGHGPFASPVLNESLLSCQLYITIISITILAMRAAINEREQSETALQMAHNELAALVNKRTEKLADYQNRIESIFSAILKYTVLDFSQ